jgi:hypothetical protein
MGYEALASFYSRKLSQIDSVLYKSSEIRLFWFIADNY